MPPTCVALPWWQSPLQRAPKETWRRDPQPRSVRAMPRPFDLQKETARDLSRVADAFVDADADLATKRGYLARLGAPATVLDVGCGQGRFLDVLAERGIEGLGLDASSDAVAACVARGLTVLQGDGLVLLRRLHEDRRKFAGVVLAHVVEHFDGATVAEWIAACARVVMPGGRLLVATPNSRSLIVLEEVFWLDPTHVRPYPRALLEKLGRDAGLQVVASYDDSTTVPRRSLLRRVLARLRSLLSGADRSAPLDSVVVFEKPKA